MLIEIDENPRKTSSTLFMFARDLKNQASKPNNNKFPHRRFFNFIAIFIYSRNQWKWEETTFPNCHANADYFLKRRQNIFVATYSLLANQ